MLVAVHRQQARARGFIVFAGLPRALVRLERAQRLLRRSIDRAADLGDRIASVSGSIVRRLTPNVRCNGASGRTKPSSMPSASRKPGIRVPGG
ncbi:hypothetical protein [uncultured Massilia sp.]|uniref:hypothetical protein n=1 Tax=uncultured Massilia sp. TaxID=169973 RepID=UPI0025E721E3|nr:hypothetical protein [uncultured Massilia sp.]